PRVASLHPWQRRTCTPKTVKRKVALKPGAKAADQGQELHCGVPLASGGRAVAEAPKAWEMASREARDPKSRLLRRRGFESHRVCWRGEGRGTRGEGKRADGAGERGAWMVCGGW